MCKSKDVIKTYDNLLNKIQKIDDALSNIGRKKDYKVQKITKQYESKIDRLIRESEAYEIKLNSIKKYIGK